GCQRVGGVERLEGMQLGFFVHSDAGIANADGHILADGDCAGRRKHRTEDVFGFDEQLASGGHSVARVDHDVEDDLLEMDLVDHHGPSGAEVDHQFDV